MKLPCILNGTLGLVVLVSFVYLCEGQSRRLLSHTSSQLSPSSRFSRTFDDRRGSTRVQPVSRSRSWSRASPTRIVSRQNSFRQSDRNQRQQISSPRQNSFRQNAFRQNDWPQHQQVSSPRQNSQLDSINNLSNAILLSALLGSDMPRDQRLSNQRLILSQLLGNDPQPSQNQSPFSSFIDRAASRSVLSPSSSSSRDNGAFSTVFGNPPSNDINSLPGHNLIVQSPGQHHGQPIVIEAGGQIQVQEIKKPDGQTQMVINTSQNSPANTRATTNAASTIPSFSTVDPYILSGEDPPEKEPPPPLSDIQELTRLLKALGMSPPKAGTVGR